MELLLIMWRLEQQSTNLNTQVIVFQQHKMSTVNLRKLISISTQLSYEACNIIKQSLADTSCKKYMKGEDDPVTDADFKIQSMLSHGLKLHFPQLKIIGEESEEYKGVIDYNYSSLVTDNLPNQSKINEELDTQDACLWIDPIDCTRGFLNGNIEDVTILIGLSYRQKPYMGVIGTPYKKKGDLKSFEPVVTVGSVKARQTYDFFGEKWAKKAKPPIHNPLIVATSNTRTNTTQENFLRNLRAANITAGGSGRKIMMVINGEADAMVYLDSWTHKWDSCAGDAIIKSMGGYFTTSWGANIVYKDDPTSTYNKRGMITAINREVFERCNDAISLC